jgi:hypothetical protein
VASAAALYRLKIRWEEFAQLPMALRASRLRTMEAQKIVTPRSLLCPHAAIKCTAPRGARPYFGSRSKAAVADFSIGPSMKFQRLIIHDEYRDRDRIGVRLLVRYLDLCRQRLRRLRRITAAFGVPGECAQPNALYALRFSFSVRPLRIASFSTPPRHARLPRCLYRRGDEASPARRRSRL